MFYIRHNSDNFTIIDCDLSGENADEIIKDIKAAKAGKGIERFICSHPDEDYFGDCTFWTTRSRSSTFTSLRTKQSRKLKRTRSNDTADVAAREPVDHDEAAAQEVVAEFQFHAVRGAIHANWISAIRVAAGSGIKTGCRGSTGSGVA